MSQDTDALRAIAKSLAQMTIEWVDGGLKLTTDWRNGLEDVIYARLKRLNAKLPEADDKDMINAAQVPEELRRLSEAAPEGPWEVDDVLPFAFGPAVGECFGKVNKRAERAASFIVAMENFVRSRLASEAAPAQASPGYECEDCIGMKDHGCYCMAMGASRPGGPGGVEEPLREIQEVVAKILNPRGEREREIEAREECERRGIDPDDVCADGGVEAWMVVDKELGEGLEKERAEASAYECDVCRADCSDANPPIYNCPRAEAAELPKAPLHDERTMGPDWRAQYDAYRKQIRVLEMQLAAMTERCRALEEALKPFAAFAEARSFAQLPGDMLMTLGSPLARQQVTASHFRRAAAVLAQAEKGTSDA